MDAGDLLFNVPQPSKKDLKVAQRKMNLFIDAYNVCQYDAMNIGINDLALGTDGIKQSATRADFPLISASVLNRSKEPVFQPYTIVNKNGLRIGIAGVTEGSPVLEHTYLFKDIVASAKDALDQMRGKVDFTILLASVFNPEAKRLKKENLGYNLIVRSHTGHMSRELDTTPSGYYLDTGMQGKYMQIVDIGHPNPDSSLTDVSRDKQRLDFIEMRLDDLMKNADGQSLEEAYANNKATLGFIHNLQNQGETIKKTLNSHSNYIALRVKILGEEVGSNATWEKRVAEFKSGKAGADQP